MKKYSTCLVIACQILGLTMGLSSLAQGQSFPLKGISPYPSRQAFGPVKPMRAMRTFCAPGYTYHLNPSLCENVYDVNDPDHGVAITALPIACPYLEGAPKSAGPTRWICEPDTPEVTCPEGGEFQLGPGSTYYTCSYPDASSVPASGSCAPGFSRDGGGDFCGDDQYCCHRVPACGEAGKFLGYGTNHVLCCQSNESCSH